MRVLLEGRTLSRTENFGGVDSYWRNLVPGLLSAAPPDTTFVLLSAFLNPRRAAAMEPYRDGGALIRHFWANPEWLHGLGHLGAPAEWFAGRHDLVHTMEPVWPFRTRGRLVVSVLDLMYVHHPQFLDPRWVHRLMRGTEEMLERASFWLCISESTREELIEHFSVPRARTAVAHLGVNQRFFDAAEAEEEIRGTRAALELECPYFLFLGSVEPKKNLEMLLRAFARAVETGLEAELVVAGRAGWQSEAVRRVAEASPALQERVRFLGFVADEHLPYLVAGARALVLPSRWEGFGMPVLEAMGAGTPVLCSDRGALPEVAGEAARLFDPDDEETLAEWLQRLDGDASEREGMRRAGLERARGFTWQRCVEETLAAYARAMEVPR